MYTNGTVKVQPESRVLTPNRILPKRILRSSAEGVHPVWRKRQLWTTLPEKRVSEQELCIADFPCSAMHDPKRFIGLR